MSSDPPASKSKLSGEIPEELTRLGKYDIQRRIGSGGMGTVYLAEDRKLKRTVALKVLPRDRAENPTLVRRFQSEAQASAMLSHKNIVSVFDADQADGYLYIALEYVDGTDLFEWMLKRGTIPVKRSIDIIRQVTEALQHAHERRLVHRDIKPANIMVARDGTVKLTDMGLARSLDETLDTTITRAGTTVGTVDYMSPEQAVHSKNADITSDIYSLGCTWYHMLTGSPPYPDGDLTNKLRAHAEKPLPDPRDFNAQVSEALVAIMHRMIAKKKQDRYQTPEELLEDLDNSAHMLSGNSQALWNSLLEEDEGSADFTVRRESQAQLLERTDVGASPPTRENLSVRPQADKDESSADELISEEPEKAGPTRNQPVSKAEPPRKSVPSRPPAPLKRVSSLDELAVRTPTPEELAESESEPAARQQPRPQDRKRTTQPTGDKKSPIPPRPSTAPPPTPTDTTAPGTPLPPRKTPLPTRPQPSRSPPKQLPPRRTSTNAIPEESIDVPQSEKPPDPAQSGPTPTAQPPRQRSDSGRKPVAVPSESSSQTAVGSATTRPRANRAVHASDSDEPEVQTGIAVDWKRAGVVLTVIAFVAAVIWSVTQFSQTGIDELVNPYGLSSPSNSTPPPEQPDSVREIEQGGAAADASPATTRGTTQSDTTRPPRWVVDNSERKPRPQQAQLRVQRGRKGRDLFPNLDQALAAVTETETRIDLSQIDYEELQSRQLSLSGHLVLRGGNQGTVLYFQAPFAEQAASESSGNWLTIQGGTLELVGLHLIVFPGGVHPFQLFNLQQANLILRDCTITTLGTAPVSLVAIPENQPSPARVQIAGSLIRGTALSLLAARSGNCELYCEQSLLATQTGPLVSIADRHADRSNAAQSEATRLHFTRSTLLGAAPLLAFEFADQTSPTARSSDSLTLDRTLLLDTHAPTTQVAKRPAPLQVQLTGFAVETAGTSVEQSQTERTAEQAAMAEQLRQRLTMNLRDAWVIGREQLLDVLQVGADPQASQHIWSIETPDDWRQIWRRSSPLEALSADLSALDDIPVQKLTPEILHKTLLVEPALNAVLQPGSQHSPGLDPDRVAKIADSRIAWVVARSELHLQQSLQSAINWQRPPVRFDLKRGERLQEFLNSAECPDGSTVICHGSGLRNVSPLQLVRRRLKLVFESEEGTPLSLTLDQRHRSVPLLTIDGGVVEIEGGGFSLFTNDPTVTAPLFLDVQNGASVLIDRALVRARFTEAARNPAADLPEMLQGERVLIRMGAAQESPREPFIQIARSLFVSPASLIAWDAAHQSLELSDCILVSDANALKIQATDDPKLLSLKHCTISAAKSAIQLASLNGPLTAIVENCLFAPEHTSAEAATLLSGGGWDDLQASLHWWENGCAISSRLQIPVAVAGGNAPIFEFTPESWNSRLSNGFVSHRLLGPQSIVFVRELTGRTELSLEDFTLLPSCDAAVWSSDGGPVGARPDVMLGQSARTSATPVGPGVPPRQLNTRDGF